MGKAQSIYFPDTKVLEKAEEEANKSKRSLSFYVSELVKKDVDSREKEYLEQRNKDCKDEY